MPSFLSQTILLSPSFKPSLHYHDLVMHQIRVSSAVAERGQRYTTEEETLTGRVSVDKVVNGAIKKAYMPTLKPDS